MFKTEFKTAHRRRCQRSSRWKFEKYSFALGGACRQAVLFTAGPLPPPPAKLMHFLDGPSSFSVRIFEGVNFRRRTGRHRPGPTSAHLPISRRSPQREQSLRNVHVPRASFEGGILPVIQRAECLHPCIREYSLIHETCLERYHVDVV